MAYKPIIAVDFDDTLSIDGKWPEVGEPNLDLINYLLEAQSKGWSVVLWTCREGEELDMAVEFCKQHGLTFDSINENPSHVPWKSRKVVANMYIDDRAVHVEDYRRIRL